MAKILLISTLIVLAFCAKATHEQREELRDPNIRQDMAPHQIHELFPRVCGLHGWKKCRGRRRSSVKVTMTINIISVLIEVAIIASVIDRKNVYLCRVLNLHLIILYVFHFYLISPRAAKVFKNS